MAHFQKIYNNYMYERFENNLVTFVNRLMIKLYFQMVDSLLINDESQTLWFKKLRKKKELPKLPLVI